MKSLVRCAPLALAIAGLLFSSCDLVTVPNPVAAEHPAGHLVINEVFTLPDTSVNPYSWVELFNASDKPLVGLSNYTFTYTRTNALGQPMRRSFQLRFYQPATGELIDTLEAGFFLLMYSDSIHFYNHTNLGPGKGYQAWTFSLTTLQESDELVLSDTSGNPIDVVRYGDYVSPLSPDPFPDNHSAGMIPAWSSLSRYAGGYFTGNSANDFYIESKPIPKWYSELHHP